MGFCHVNNVVCKKLTVYACVCLRRTSTDLRQMAKNILEDCDMSKMCHSDRGSFFVTWSWMDELSGLGGRELDQCCGSDTSCHIMLPSY